MVEDRITDGRRIAELLASEVEGRAGDLADISVADADREVEPSVDGTPAYDVAAGGERIARAFVHPDRVRLEVEADPERALTAARDLDLRARPVGADPPRTAVFVESGAEAKRAGDVLGAVARDSD